jgi:hypothetical protein
LVKKFPLFFHNHLFTVHKKKFAVHDTIPYNSILYLSFITQIYATSKLIIAGMLSLLENGKTTVFDEAAMSLKYDP